MKKNGQCFDKIELKIAMIRNQINQKELAKKIGLCNATFIKKMHGKTPFKDRDILRIKTELNLSGEDLVRIFFKEQKSQLH